MDHTSLLNQLEVNLEPLLSRTCDNDPPWSTGSLLLHSILLWDLQKKNHMYLITIGT